MTETAAVLNGDRITLLTYVTGADPTFYPGDV